MDMTFAGGESHDPLGHDGAPGDFGADGFGADDATSTAAADHFAADTGSVFDAYDTGSPAPDFDATDFDGTDVEGTGRDAPDHAGITPVASVTPVPGDSDGTAGHLFLHQDGRIWDLGPADVDTDADGVRDSLTRSGPDGLTVYTDTDKDGQVDKITEVDAHGKYSSSTLDRSSGAWVSGDSGRIG